MRKALRKGTPSYMAFLMNSADDATYRNKRDDYTFDLLNSQTFQKGKRPKRGKGGTNTAREGENAYDNFTGGAMSAKEARMSHIAAKKGGYHGKGMGLSGSFSFVQEEILTPRGRNSGIDRIAPLRLPMESTE